MFVFSAKTILAGGLIALSGFAFNPPLKAAPLVPSFNPQGEAKAGGYDFAGVERPGRQTSGDSRAQCPKKSMDLTALMPQSHTGKTVQERPTFWIYVPYTAQEIARGEFSLQREDRSDVYRASFNLPPTPGFVRVSLPDSVPPLSKNQPYRWYFKLYCQSSLAEVDKSFSPTFVQGWVERVEAPTPMDAPWPLYAQEKIWYDAIASLANLRLQNPQDPQLAQDWQNLLEAKGVDLSFGEGVVLKGTVEFSNFSY